MARIRIVSLLMLLSLLVATNSFLPLMQVVAWAGMIVNYSQEADLAKAIAMTFDGDHPCSMCKAIQAEQENTNPDEIRGESLGRMVLFIESSFIWHLRPTLLDTLAVTSTYSSRLPHQPETPPPRSAAC